PEADGYIIGGGYPEMFGGELEENTAMRESIREVARDGVPIYAECGGLMYLTERIGTAAGWQGHEKEESWEMCGVFSGYTHIPARRVVSYVEGTAEGKSPVGQGKFRGHEFHYSDVHLEKGTHYTYRLTRGIGIRDGWDGALVYQTLASYLHLHPLPSHRMFQNFLECCRKES
ncbi:MAG TPA: Ni-sirohydrochlorin a,c-diamide synthase, partial [Methanomicrobiales archaeon]|nr:Ni-sirohydrochlorin a,c-diamide synthase [Methanomicrobiales archaeon]